MRFRGVAATMSFTVVANHAIILERQSLRNLANLLMSLPLRGLFRFHDQVVDAHLLDQRHDFLPRARADREHRDHGRHAENHPQHGEQ